METIGPNARVVLDYALRDESGAVLDASESEGGEPIVYVHGYGMIVPGLEAGLEGLRAGDGKTIVVAPEAGFGEHDPELVLELDRTDVPRPKDVAEGDEFIAESPEGDEVIMRVIEVVDDAVVVDANHPLAGMTLHYEVKVREVRAATDAEIRDAADLFEQAGYGGDAPDPAAELVQLRPPSRPAGGGPDASKKPGDATGSVQKGGFAKDAKKDASSKPPAKGGKSRPN